MTTPGSPQGPRVGGAPRRPLGRGGGTSGTRAASTRTGRAPGRGRGSREAAPWNDGGGVRPRRGRRPGSGGSRSGESGRGSGRGRGRAGPLGCVTWAPSSRRRTACLASESGAVEICGAVAHVRHFARSRCPGPAALCRRWGRAARRRRGPGGEGEMASLLKTSSLTVRTKLLHQSSLYNTSHGFHEEEVKRKLLQFPGGSIDLQKEDSGIGILTLNNPSKMNAFSGVMMLQLLEKVIELENWKEGKGIIVRGAKSTFSSGSDLNAVKALGTPEDGMALCMFMQNTLTRFMRLPLISVALIQGRALGGGAEFTTACDFRLMTKESEIRFVHKEMGIVPSWGGATRLVEIIGSRQALKILSGALKLDSQKALNIGMADEILKSSDENESLEEAQEWLKQYIKGPPEVIRAMKTSVSSVKQLCFEEALQTERDLVGSVWGGPANLEAIARRGKFK